jgi:hypothetical protein
MELAHTKTVEEILQEFKVTEEDGLNNSRVEELRRKHGLNGKREKNPVDREFCNNGGISLGTFPLSRANGVKHCFLLMCAWWAMLWCKSCTMAILPAAASTT